MYYFKLLIGIINLKIIIYLLLIFILFKFLNNRYPRNPQWVKFSKELPGPRDYPIIGSGVDLLLGVKGGLGPLFVKYMNTYGSTFRLWLGTYLAVVVSDVNDVQTALTSSNCLGKSELAEPWRTAFGNGIAFAEPVAVWKHKRRAFRPFFSKTILLDFVQEMNAVNYKHVEKMKKEVDGAEFDLQDYTIEVSFDTIMKTHFNYAISDQERKELNFYRNSNEALVKIFICILLPYSIIKPIVHLFLPIDVIKTRKLLFNYADKVVNLIQKSSNWANEKEVTETRTLNKETLAQSYIRQLIQSEKELREPDLVRSEIITIILGGIESTGYTIAFCLLALAANPEIQEKVYQELYQVFGDDERPAEASDLNKFPYLEQVISETQRLFTTGTVLLRKVEKDTKIGPHIHPAGTFVMINTGGIHHNAKIYPNPYRFNPDNFTPEAVKNRHPYSFIPFSAGPRNCIGKDYAEITMKLRLIAFLRVFTFHTKIKLENIKKRFGAIEGSACGYPVSVTLRGRK